MIEHGVLYYHHYDDRYIKSHSTKSVVKNNMLVPEGFTMVKMKKKSNVKPEEQKVVKNKILSDLIIEDIVAAYKIGKQYTLICIVSKQLFVVEFQFLLDLVLTKDLSIKNINHKKITDTALKDFFIDYILKNINIFTTIK